MDISLALFAGSPIPVPGLPLVMHQPQIKEIALIGDIDFFTGIQCLTINKQMITQGETLLANFNNFQIFMKLMSEKETADKKEAVISLLSLIFPDYKIVFTPRSLIFNQIKDKMVITIDESNFDLLQDIIQKVFCMSNGPMESQTFNPANAKAKEIADKLMRARQRVAEIKGEKNGSIFVQYASVIAVGLQYPLSECLSLTMYQLFDLVERYSLWLNWDLDIRSRLAGGQPDSKPDNWMKNIH